MRVAITSQGTVVGAIQDTTAILGRSLSSAARSRREVLPSGGRTRTLGPEHGRREPPMSSADAPRRWDRPATLALVALLFVALSSLFWLVPPWYEAGDETNDASIYIACAKSMLAGEGYAYLGEPFTVRPPGFSALIALL